MTYRILPAIAAFALASSISLPAEAASMSRGGFSRPSYRSVPRISPSKPAVRSYAPAPKVTPPAPKVTPPAAPSKPAFTIPPAPKRPIVINRNVYTSPARPYRQDDSFSSSFMPSFLGSYLGSTLAQPNPAPAAAPVIINGTPSTTVAPATQAAPAAAPAYAQEDDTVRTPDSGLSWMAWLAVAAALVGGFFLIRRKAA
jgi:hypothetical protein